MDQRGNLTSDGVWTYGYDTENRLVSASRSGTTVSYSYDALGRRYLKTVNGTTTAWLSYGDQELAEYTGTGTVYFSRMFAYGAGLDEPVLSVAPGGASTYQFQDALGSVIALANASGQVTEKYAYTAYGQTVATGAGTAAYRFTGRRFDAETGLYFYRARAYSPTLGRFLQTDPIGTKDNINLYAYVGNDPVNATDPLGLDCVSSGGITSCSTSAYNVNFPTPKGWQDFTSSSTNYHVYSTPANVGSANPTAVQQWVANNPTPGSPSAASSQGTLNDATPVLGGVSPINISPVLSYTTTNQANGSPVVLNVTLPGHPLFPGIVVRQVNQTSNGTVINNYGEGTSALQSPSTFAGSEFGPSINGVWTGQVPCR